MRIVIPGDPIPKRRPRFFVKAGKIHGYDSQRIESKEVSSAMLYTINRSLSSSTKQIVIEASNLTVANELHVTLDFTLPIPRKLNISEINAVLWGFGEQVSKPDIDNMVKFYLDCGNGVLWKDDCLITHLHATKRYGEKPQTVINIMSPKKNFASQAKEILSELNPEEILQLSEHSHELAILVNDLKQDPSDTNSELYCERINTISSILSRLADKYSRSLTRIHKRYPGFWQNDTVK